jgi:hypothetical protein
MTARPTAQLSPSTPIEQSLGAMPCSLSDFVRVINAASTDWVNEKIHPYVPRSQKDTNASYLRKMAIWAQSTNTYPANARDLAPPLQMPEFNWENVHVHTPLPASASDETGVKP